MVYNVAAVLWLQFMLIYKNVLYCVEFYYISTVRSLYAAPGMADFFQFIDFVLSCYVVHVFSE